MRSFTFTTARRLSAGENGSCKPTLTNFHTYRGEERRDVRHWHAFAVSPANNLFPMASPSLARWRKLYSFTQLRAPWRSSRVIVFLLSQSGFTTWVHCDG